MNIKKKLLPPYLLLRFAAVGCGLSALTDQEVIIMTNRKSFNFTSTFIVFPLASLLAFIIFMLLLNQPFIMAGLIMTVIYYATVSIIIATKYHVTLIEKE